MRSILVLGAIGLSVTALLYGIAVLQERLHVRRAMRNFDAEVRHLVEQDDHG